MYLACGSVSAFHEFIIIPEFKIFYRLLNCAHHEFKKGLNLINYDVSLLQWLAVMFLSSI
jgi:hypothetical protein